MTHYLDINTYKNHLLTYLITAIWDASLGLKPAPAPAGYPHLLPPKAWGADGHPPVDPSSHKPPGYG